MSFTNEELMAFAERERQTERRMVELLARGLRATSNDQDKRSQLWAAWAESRAELETIATALDKDD